VKKKNNGHRAKMHIFHKILRVMLGLLNILQNPLGILPPKERGPYSQHFYNNVLKMSSMVMGKVFNKWNSVVSAGTLFIVGINNCVPFCLNNPDFLKV
jgi:hypothetical protein